MIKNVFGTIILSSFAVGALAGCGKEDGASSVAQPDPSASTEPAEASAQQQDPAAQQQDPDLAIVTITAVDIDTQLAAMCEIPESKVFFKFDSAKVLPEAKGRLDRIAECVLSGAAKDKELLLVGRAGPIGTDEYNKQLGMSRAESVSKYLAEHGVAKSRVETVSKGEAAAAESYPSTWPYDRRVTIRLQP